jgi:hypothetical protein
MLKKFDNFCENLLIEGRKSDDKKQFKIDTEIAKQLIDGIGEKQHHYRNDKMHFSSILDSLNPNTVYTPKTFMEQIKSYLKGVGKHSIADGYSKMFYVFLKDQVNTPFKDYNKEEEAEETQETEPSFEDGSVQYDEVLPPNSDQQPSQQKA